MSHIYSAKDLYSEFKGIFEDDFKPGMEIVKDLKWNGDHKIRVEIGRTGIGVMWSLYVMDVGVCIREKWEYGEEELGDWKAVNDWGSCSLFEQIYDLIEALSSKEITIFKITKPKKGG